MSKEHKSQEEKYADKVFEGIIKFTGGQYQLVENPQVHIVIAMLNIDINDLIDR